LVYSWIAEPLQQLAAWIAVHVLSVTGVQAFSSGTKIVMLNKDLQPRTLNVAEACAGMRSLMTFISVGSAIAFLSSRILWEKLVIAFSAVPIAIFCNMARISVQGLLDHYVSTEWSESFAHQFVGMMMLLPAFFMILGVGYLLDKMFIEVADDDRAPLVPRKVEAVAPRKVIDNTGSAMQPVTARIIAPAAIPVPVAKAVATVVPADTKPVPPVKVISAPVAAAPPRAPRSMPAAPRSKGVTVADGMSSPRAGSGAAPMRMPPPPPGSVLRRPPPIAPRIIEDPVPPKPVGPKADDRNSQEAGK
jgi:exosortase/archaeosortase family protein